MKLKKRTDNGIYMLTHNGKRISTGERIKSKAETAARLIIRNNGTLPARGCTMTLRESLKDTYERHWQNLKSEKGFRYIVNRLTKEWGHIDIADINYKWLTEFVELHRERSHKNATINRELSCISKTLREAQKLGLINNLPPMPMQPEKPKKMRWITHDEQLLLCRLVGDTLLRPKAEFMEATIHGLCYTGARISEYIKACREGEFSDTHMTFTDTKNGKDRSIPLAPEILPWIRKSARYLQENPKIDSGWCVKYFSKLRDYAGLSDVSLHTLRRTCASRLVQAGVDLYRVMTWLGHTSIKTTQRYAILAPSSLDEAPAHLLPPVERDCTPLHTVQNGG